MHSMTEVHFHLGRGVASGKAGSRHRDRSLWWAGPRALGSSQVGVHEKKDSWARGYSSKPWVDNNISSSSPIAAEGFLWLSPLSYLELLSPSVRNLASYSPMHLLTWPSLAVCNQALSPPLVLHRPSPHPLVEPWALSVSLSHTRLPTTPSHPSTILCHCLLPLQMCTLFRFN